MGTRSRMSPRHRSADPSDQPNSPRTIDLTERARDALAGSHTIVVPTDVADDEQDHFLDAVADVAAACDPDHPTTVVLYDRSNETWMDTPHPNGPYRSSELSDDHTDLARQLDRLGEAGVNALGWISTVPALTDILTAVQRVSADAVLLHDDHEHRGLFDQLLRPDKIRADSPQSGDVIREVSGTLDRQLDESVSVFVLADSTVDLATVTAEGTSVTDDD